MGDHAVQEVAAMRSFCERTGELILWGSAIDGQLTQAVILACSLKKSPLLGPVVAELGVRAKCDILRSRVKHIKEPNWSRGIGKWVKAADKVNTYRNIVAHHQVKSLDGKLTLYAGQARKLLGSIENGKLNQPKTINDIRQWIEAAKRAYEQGQVVLANLESFAEAMKQNRA